MVIMGPFQPRAFCDSLMWIMDVSSSVQWKQLPCSEPREAAFFLRQGSLVD